MPPQPNYPSAVVPRKVSSTKTIGWCYIVAFPGTGAPGATLPPTLYDRLRTTAANYSKALWGLLVPLRVSWICTGNRSSLGIRSRQRRSRSNIHAGRQLIDKGLRYLKTVRVTAAVYQVFGPLKRTLSHWHWAVLRSHKNRFRLSTPYVFVKQSDLPGLCDSSGPSEMGG